MEENIMNILTKINEELLTYEGDNMMMDGLVDSFGVLRIISELEDTFDIEIDAADVTTENFGNKNRIIALIEGLVKD